MTSKFKMLVRLEDGSEHRETVQDCVSLAGAEFEATNTVRFWNKFLRATDQRKELINVYQEERSNEQDAKTTHSRMASPNIVSSDNTRNETSSSSIAETKVIVRSTVATSQKVAPVQRKLF